MSEVIAGMAKVGYPRLLAGGMAYEFYLPVRAGDILVFSIKVKEMSEKEGKGGISMIITIFEKSYLNQSGDPVARCDHTLIFRQ
jgi:acyl dehydratase